MKKLDHVGIVTDNLAKSLAFFEGSLGLRCTHQEELPERGIRVAFLPIGDTRIELIEPLHANSEVSGFLAKRGPGVHHLAFESESAPSKLETIKPFELGADGAQIAFVHPKKTGGVLVEVCVHES
ncbi:MAG: VOC family protein [Deltaproteobacteria bacterium]|nr:VOC family protein [Deltaproteobacteria bacterium]